MCIIARVRDPRPAPPEPAQTTESPVGSAGAVEAAPRWLYLVPLAIALVALVCVAYFDLQTNLSFNDEYARRWTIQRFLDGHGLALWGANPGLVQLAAAGLVALSHSEPRFWRLAVLPFIAVAGLFAWKTARRLGADRFWAATAAATVVAGPITLSLATGLMTETVFLGLFLGATWFALRWVLDGKGMAWCVAWAVLATLQRPQGGGLVLGVAAGLWLASNSRRLKVRDFAGLAILSLGVIAAYELPNRLFRGVATPGVGPPQSVFKFAFTVANVVSLPVMLGLLLLPFVVGMLARLPVERHRLGRMEMIPAAIAFAGLVGSGTMLVALHSDILPGNYLGKWGLGPKLLPGPKVDLFPLPLLLPMELVALVAGLVLLAWRRRVWQARLLGTGGAMLTVFAISQFLPLLWYAGLFDRYFVLVAAPLAPLLAAMVSRSDWRPRLSAAWAIAFLGVGLVTYVVGQQDYTGWQVARDIAARSAYSQAPPVEVQAGYEETAEHVWVPAADDPSLPRDLVNNPRIYLVFTGPNDPRPGASYSSLSPGRIIIVRAR